MNKRFLLIVLGLFTCALVSACGVSTDQPGTTPTIPSSSSPGVPPSVTPVPLATLMPAPTFTPTAIPTATPNPTPTASPTSPVVWYVQAAEIPATPDVNHHYWLDNEMLVLEYFYMVSEASVVVDWVEVLVYVKIRNSLDQPPMLSPSPTPFMNLEEDRLKYSPSGVYVVECGETSTNFYRVEDEVLLATTDIVIQNCYWIDWNSDESALNFTVEIKAGDSKVYTTEIYVWKTDGSQPFTVGKGSFLDDPGSWSPDGQRLAVEIMDFTTNNPEDEYRYDILFLDGRQQIPIRADLAPRDDPGVSWLTNNIVYEDNTYSVTCLYTTYYAARTGEEIPEMAYRNCLSYGPYETYNNQLSLLSPNQRWFIVDVTDDAFLEPEDQVDYTYHVFDIQEDKTYPLGNSATDCLDFVGWAADSSRFYFLRRPYDLKEKEQPGEMYGLIAYDPVNQLFFPLNPYLHYAWLSPDLQKLLGVIKQEDGFYAGLFSIHGQPLSELTRIETNPEWQPPYDPEGDRSDINVSWSSDSSQVAFADFSGSLWWIKESGDTYLLAERLPQEALPKTGLLWSPDNSRLVVMAEPAFAWVIYLPSSP